LNLQMEGRMVAAVATEDDWHSVKDAKKRKQIQDRLAQRARRMNIPLVLNFFLFQQVLYGVFLACLAGLPPRSEVHCQRIPSCT
jgi:hypothetical protein